MLSFRFWPHLEYLSLGPFPSSLLWSRLCKLLPWILQTGLLPPCVPIYAALTLVVFSELFVHLISVTYAPDPTSLPYQGLHPISCLYRPPLLDFSWICIYSQTFYLEGQLNMSPFSADGKFFLVTQTKKSGYHPWSVYFSHNLCSDDQQNLPVLLSKHKGSDLFSLPPSLPPLLG